VTENLLVARRRGDATVLAHARATSPLRLVRPTFPGSRASAVCLVTFGGGLVDGDAVDVRLEVEPEATLVVFTQASTKVFRGSSSQSIRASVAGTLVLLPDPVSCFAGARYRQRVDVALEDDGACVLLDAFTAGRPAFGERWAFARMDLRTTVTRAGRVVGRDALVLDAADGSIGDRMGRFEAFATVLAIGAEPVASALLEEAPMPIAPRDVVAAPSALPGGAIVRIAGARPSDVVAETRRRLRNLPDIDAVDPFASRH
jgi:urease accessory protein